MNETNNDEEQNIDIDSKKRKQGQMLLVILVAVILVAGGIIFYANSLTGKKAADESSDLENIMPHEAQNKSNKQKEKYGKDYNRKLTGENYNADLDAITGEEKEFAKRSNEHLTEKDFEEVRQAAYDDTPVLNNPATRNAQTKERMNRENQRTIRNAQREIAYHADPSTPLFKKSEEELREERLAALERENNVKLTESILKGLDKAQHNQGAGLSGSPANGSQLNKPVQKRPSVGPDALQNNANENTIGRATTTGFYSDSRSLEAEQMSKYTYIPAVVHGNGDGIKVQDGSNVKLRLLAETYINIGGMKTVLPRNSLLNGTIRISNDRLNILVNSVRIDNSVVPVKMIAYDIDGSQGLYIPNLTDKNLLARELAEAGARPLQGSVWTQGSFQQQVGTQVATEAARSLIQGTSQYARRKTQIVRVTIKPNYKVLLTAGTLENTEQSESISNY